MTEFAYFHLGVNDIVTRPISRAETRKNLHLIVEGAEIAGMTVSVDWRCMRPSRGWARHVRRIKATARTAS